MNDKFKSNKLNPIPNPIPMFESARSIVNKVLNIEMTRYKYLVGAANKLLETILMDLRVLVGDWRNFTIKSIPIEKKYERNFLLKEKEEKYRLPAWIDPFSTDCNISDLKKIGYFFGIEMDSLLHEDNVKDDDLWFQNNVKIFFSKIGFLYRMRETYQGVIQYFKFFGMRDVEILDYEDLNSYQISLLDDNIIKQIIRERKEKFVAFLFKKQEEELVDASSDLERKLKFVRLTIPFMLCKDVIYCAIYKFASSIRKNYQASAQQIDWKIELL